MTRYRVRRPIIGHLEVEVDADNPDEAEKKAVEAYVELSQTLPNGLVPQDWECCETATGIFRYESPRTITSAVTPIVEEKNATFVVTPNAIDASTVVRRAYDVGTSGAAARAWAYSIAAQWPASKPEVEAGQSGPFVEVLVECVATGASELWEVEFRFTEEGLDQDAAVVDTRPVR